MSRVLELNGRMRVPAAVLYHYPCPDGVFAALAAKLYHQTLGQAVHFYPNTVYRPLSLEDLNVDKYETFYLLDFVGPEGFAVDLCKKARNSKIVVLDHHKTAAESMASQQELPGNLHLVLDMNRSGATISYDYFRDSLAGIKAAEMLPSCDVGRVEKMFKYIEDADLGKWRIPESKAFSSGLKDLALEYDARANPSIFTQLLGLDLDELISNGRSSLEEKQKKIHRALEASFQVQIGGGKFGSFLAVRADDLHDLRSDLGNQLAEKSSSAGLRPIGAVVYRVEALEDTSTLKVSLRSTKDTDTSEISQAYGGGGHRCASSFMIHAAEFENWCINTA